MPRDLQAWYGSFASDALARPSRDRPRCRSRGPQAHARRLQGVPRRRLCARPARRRRTPKDFDVATSATPNEIKATFRNSRIIGRRFRLAHVFFGSKIIETATFRANPRDEDDHDLLIRRDNVFGTETEDARRRDFTINGLFYDVEREEVIDHVGGLADLEAKLVRTIGDPDIRFQEDPVRMLRAIKFAARLDFGFEPATWRALLRWRGEISKCAPPRLLEEIHRLLRGGAARRSFELHGRDRRARRAVAVPRRPARGRRRAGDRAAARRCACRARRSRASSTTRTIRPSTTPTIPSEEPDARPTTRPRPRTTHDLDDEEQAWHRVWADEPPARPAAAAPVRLSFVPAGAELVRAPRARVGGARRRSTSRSPTAAIRRTRSRSARCSRRSCPTSCAAASSTRAVHELVAAADRPAPRHPARQRAPALPADRAAQARARRSKRGAQAELAGGRELIDDAVLLYDAARARRRQRAPSCRSRSRQAMATASDGSGRRR